MSRPLSFRPTTFGTSSSPPHRLGREADLRSDCGMWYRKHRQRAYGGEPSHVPGQLVLVQRQNSWRGDDNGLRAGLGRPLRQPHAIPRTTGPSRRPCTGTRPATCRHPRSTTSACSRRSGSAPRRSCRAGTGRGRRRPGCARSAARMPPRRACRGRGAGLTTGRKDAGERGRESRTAGHPGYVGRRVSYRRPRPRTVAAPACRFMPPAERQVTHAPHGHILTNVNRLVARRPADRLRRPLRPGRRQFRRRPASRRSTSRPARSASCTVRRAGRSAASRHTSPVADHVAFILGPEDPTPDFTYGPARRRGVLVDEDGPGEAIPLDARDLVPPFTPGALRGGSHVHVFSPDGSRRQLHLRGPCSRRAARPGGERNHRNVGVSRPRSAGRVPPATRGTTTGTAFTSSSRAPATTRRRASDEISEGVRGRLGRNARLPAGRRVLAARGPSRSRDM